MQPSLTEFLFSAHGRVSLHDFWVKWAIGYIVVTVVVTGIAMGLIGGTAGAVISGVYYLAALWPSIAIYIKRAHDRGRSGWFLLLFLVPILKIWVMVELLFLPGKSSAIGTMRAAA